jgi:hypothetical protein
MKQELQYCKNDIMLQKGTFTVVIYFKFMKGLYNLILYAKMHC